VVTVKVAEIEITEPHGTDNAGKEDGLPPGVLASASDLISIVGIHR
jgi:hypothetical protein